MDAIKEIMYPQWQRKAQDRVIWRQQRLPNDDDDEYPQTNWEELLPEYIDRKKPLTKPTSFCLCGVEHIVCIIYKKKAPASLKSGFHHYCQNNHFAVISSISRNSQNDYVFAGAWQHRPLVGIFASNVLISRYVTAPSDNRAEKMEQSDVPDRHRLHVYSTECEFKRLA